MPIATPRYAQARQGGGPKPMNARSVRMMVSSGVVRRADSTAALVPNRRERTVPTVTGRGQSQSSVWTQGWLLRMLVRRKSTVSL